MQPVRTDRQIRGPGDDAAIGFALRDNLKTGNDFPAQRKRGSVAQFGPRGPAGANHHRLLKKSVRCPYRKGIENDLQRLSVRHMAVTLAVEEFGLDSEVFSLAVKGHSARCLHATVSDVAKFSRCGKRITVFNCLAAPAFPGNECPASGFL